MSELTMIKTLKFLLAIAVSVQHGAAADETGALAVTPAAPRPDHAPRPTTAPTELVWDAIIKEHEAQAGETAKAFTFDVTNTSSHEMVIFAVTPSCGCTVVKLPPRPWKLSAGEQGLLQASMDWRGRFGLFTKTILVETSAGPQTLTLKIKIPAPAEAIEIPIGRARNLQIASADRQAVFKPDCAKCHAEPTTGKAGKELYVAACGICHEAAQRATMVPDLKALPHPTDRAFWSQWVAHGKAGSLMPAFAKTEGGPLTASQIDSLVEYSTLNIPSRTDAPPRNPAIK